MAVSKLGFVLYGGTAAALRFGHRQLVDFDFFSSQKISENKLLDIFPWLHACKKIQDNDSAYSYITNYGAKVSFVSNFSIGRLGQPEMDEATGIQIASPEDIFALKLKAIHDLIALRDFIDIAELIRQGYSLKAALIGSQTLIQGMVPPQFTVQALLWHEHPEFAAFSQKDKDAIANACADLDFEAISGKTSQIACETLQDKTLWKRFHEQHPD